jgi:hypothetical protein
MSWTITQATDEDTWTREYAASILDGPDVPLPEQKFSLGSVEARWFSAQPRVAVILTQGGSVDDRAVVEAILRTELRYHGYRQATFTFDGMTKEGNWTDIMGKAKRLIQSNQVQLLRNGYSNIVAHVVGDHGEYNCEISREDPDSRAITQWQCECPWDQYAFQRTRKWKKYEGRPCAHVLATYWKSLSTPLDEDNVPVGPGGSPSPTPYPSTPAPASPGGAPRTFLPEDGGGASESLPMPAVAPNAGGDAGVIPGQPMQALPPYQPGSTPAGQQAPPNAVSAPGARMPTPNDPVQQMGTLSHQRHVAQGQSFENGMMVRLEQEDWGVAEGPGGGAQQLVPKGSIGEVLGQDRITGWVDCMFAGPCRNNGPNMPTHIRLFTPPNYLTLAGWVKAPGPAIKRH